MTAISLLLVFFLGVGIFAKSYNGGVRWFLAAGIAVFLLYIYLT